MGATTTSLSAQGEAATADAWPAVKDHAAGVELGRMLFYDPLLSSDRWVSCGSCHQPGLVFSDGLKHAMGVEGRKGVRNAPSLLDVGQQRSLFWDGRRASLEEQALDPLLHPAEHNLSGEAQLLERLRAEPRYAPALQAAYGTPISAITVKHVARAIATFERTLVSGTSPFDRYLKEQAGALSPGAERGWAVFDRTAQCTRCHQATPGVDGRPLFTDHRFHARASTVREMQPRLPTLTARLKELHRVGKAYDPKTLTDPEVTQLGRYAFTLQRADVARFKTPGLRNVALSAPYMHDGRAATLGEAVDMELLDRSTRSGARAKLSTQQRSDLLEFLESLTGQSAAEVIEGGSPDALGPGAPPVP